jgi:hypothetical protein
MLGPEDDWRDPSGGWTIDVHLIHTTTSKGRPDMRPTRTHLMAVAAALSTIAIAVPVSTASATTAAPAGAPAAVVTGASYITTAPATFVNTNNQVSAAAVSSGGQVVQ